MQIHKNRIQEIIFPSPPTGPGRWLPLPESGSAGGLYNLH